MAPALAISEFMQILAASEMATLFCSAIISRKSLCSRDNLNDRLSPNLSLLLLLTKIHLYHAYIGNITNDFIGIDL
jgi:hypothetical protein